MSDSLTVLVELLFTMVEDGDYTVKQKREMHRKLDEFENAARAELEEESDE